MDKNWEPSMEFLYPDALIGKSQFGDWVGDIFDLPVLDVSLTLEHVDVDVDVDIIDVDVIYGLLLLLIPPANTLVFQASLNNIKSFTDTNVFILFVVLLVLKLSWLLSFFILSFS